MSMIIVESMLSHRIFSDQVAGHDREHADRLIVGLGRGAAVVLMTYFGLKWVALAHGRHWDLLLTPYGAWWMVEVFGFVLVPCLLFVWAWRIGNANLTRFAAVLAVLGIVLNRLNVSLITFRWNQPDRYVPSWMEVAITISIVTAGLLTFRWIVNRMPVLHDDPEFPPEHGEPG